MQYIMVITEWQDIMRQLGPIWQELIRITHTPLAAILVIMAVMEQPGTTICIMGLRMLQSLFRSLELELMGQLVRRCIMGFSLGLGIRILDILRCRMLGLMRRWCRRLIIMLSLIMVFLGGFEGSLAL